MRHTITSIALIFMLAAAASAEENLDQWVATALADNPQIGAADARWQAFHHRITEAGALEDPMMMLGIQNALVRDPLNFRTDPMTQKVIGISQLLPFFGKRAARTDLARSEAEVWRWQVAERKLELAQMVRETAYRIYAIDHAIDLTGRNRRLLDEMIHLAETRYAVGEGSQEAVLRAQVARSRIQDLLLVLQRDRRTRQALLNELMARPQATPVGAIPALSPEPVRLTAESLRARAMELRPQLRSLAASIDKSKAGRRLADLEFYPDVTVSFEYMQRDPLQAGMGGVEGDDMYGLTLSFNLPVQRERRKAMARAAAAENASAEAELRRLINAIDRGITERLAELDQRADRLWLYRDAILPQAEQSLAASVAAYQVGQIPFDTLLGTQMALFADERDYHETLADYHVTLARLETLVGGPLED